LFPITNDCDLEDVNNLLGDFLGRAKRTKKKESTKPSEESMEEHISSADKKIKEHTKMHSSLAKDNVKEPFGEVAKQPRTIDRISPNREGGMSLKTVEECEDEAAKAESRATLKAEGVAVEEECPDIFLPDEAKMTEDSKTTGMSEFGKDLYVSAGVIEPSENDTTRIQPS